MAARLAGPWAGAVAVVALLLLDGIVSLAWRGASEPLLLACVLWAVERHLAGRRGTAFALAVAAALIRPEVVPFLAVYAALRWRATGARDRALLAAGLALVPLLWIGVPALGGDPLAASATAQADGARPATAWDALTRGLGLLPWLVWPLAALAVALRPRDRVVRGLALGAVAWLALVIAMTAAGYSGVARYMLPAAALVAVLAAVSVGELARRRRAAVAALAVAACAGFAAWQLSALADQVRAGVRVARLQEELVQVVAATRATTAIERCALAGAVAVNHTAQTALAWDLRVPLDRVARTLRRPGIVVRAPRSSAVGSPPPVALPGPLARSIIARVGAWRVETVATVGSDPPTCQLAGVRAGVRGRAENTNA